MRLRDSAFEPLYEKRWFVWGMPLSGKSSLGKKLRKLLPFPVFDLDAEIEKETGKSIPEIFANEGEEAFRHIEKELLYKITENNVDFLLVTGGGTPCFGDNAGFMLNNGNCLFMDTALDEILKRAKASSGRPLLEGNTGERLTNLHAQRLPIYQTAHAVFYSEKEALQYFNNLVT